MDESLAVPNVHIPHYPLNSVAREFIRVLDGESRPLLMAMRDSIENRFGTPQATEDWQEPDKWIHEILAGAQSELALKLWRDSKKTVNPRYITGVWLFSKNYGLLEIDSGDSLRLSENGRDFLKNPTGATVQRIDFSEGLLQLLQIVAERGPGRRRDFIDAYIEFLERYSKYRSQASFQTSWANRINNLLERGYVTKKGQVYEISSEGLSYLERAGTLFESQKFEPSRKMKNEIYRLLQRQNQEVRQKVKDTIENMDPYAVEFLVKQLLLAMEYQNVEVTSRSGDKGVDVVADIEVGITVVREVVQVKRRRGNIGRPVLDELRGSLHRFDAMRGTIITTGGFSKGSLEAAFERGAAPITLIDGDRLVELLIENGIGVKKRELELLEFHSEDFFESKDSEEDNINILPAAY